MTPRITAGWAGGFYLLTHVTSVVAVLLYGGPDLAGSSQLPHRTTLLTGGLLEIVLAAGVVGTSVALYPLLRGSRPGLAVGYVATRTLEAGVILVGVVALLPVVAIPGTASSPELDAGAAHGLLLLHDWTFLLGPGLICPINTVVLAWLLFRTRLIATWIPVLGLVGAALVAGANLGVLYGAWATQPAAAMPIFAWEVSLALTLLVKGLRREASPR